MKRYFYLLSVTVLLFIGKVNAQVSNYSFAQSAGTYTAITTGTVYGNTASDDEVFVDPADPLNLNQTAIGPGIPIGFNFTYNGETFDRIAIDYNGWISFGKSSLTPSVNIDDESYYTSLSSASSDIPAILRNRIAALNRDLQATATAELRVATIGSGSSQTLVVQWSNVQAYSSTASSDNYSFQIRLQQTTNTVSIVYGPFTRTATANLTTQVGLGGSTSADYNNRTTTTSWSASTAGASSAATMRLSSTVLPASGLTYTWTAPSCLPPTTVSFTATAIPNVSVNWTAVSGAAGYQYRIDTTAAAPATGTATTGTTGTASTIPAGSIVYAHVRTNCGTSFSAWKTIAFIPCTTNILPANGATNVAIPTNFNWNPIAGVTTYQILLSTDNGATYPLSGVFPAPPANGVDGLAYSTTYRWYVRGIVGSDTTATTCATTTSTTFTTQAIPAAPSNDSCGAPIALTNNVAVNGTNVSATQSIAPVACGGFTSAAPVYDVWYRIAARSNGTATVTFTTTSGSFDAVLVAYSGACGSLTNIGCADAGVAGANETLNLTNLVAGQTYLIRVYGYSNGGTGQGTFTITASGPALPVTGVNLTATRNGKNVQLGWQTLTEANNAGFELQRSADGSNFTSFLKVASKANGGNSSAAINYTADDVKPFSGANYYRLKQTDKDGKISYSNVVLIKGLAVSNLMLSAIYPNPTHDVLKAAIQSPVAEKITIVISDMMGKVITRQAANVVNGDNTINLNVTNLPSGNYLLKAICSNGCETAVQKFTKQ